MKNWLRELLGIDSIDQAIAENNLETQSKLEDISRLLESNNKENVENVVETISQIKLSNDSPRWREPLARVLRTH